MSSPSVLPDNVCVRFEKIDNIDCLLSRPKLNMLKIFYHNKSAGIPIEFALSLTSIFAVFSWAVVYKSWKIEPVMFYAV